MRWKLGFFCSVETQETALHRTNPLGHLDWYCWHWVPAALQNFRPHDNAKGWTWDYLHARQMSYSNSTFVIYHYHLTLSVNKPCISKNKCLFQMHIYAFSRSFALFCQELCRDHLILEIEEKNVLFEHPLFHKHNMIWELFSFAVVQYNYSCALCKTYPSSPVCKRMLA